MEEDVRFMLVIDYRLPRNVNLLHQVSCAVCASLHC